MSKQKSKGSGYHFGVSLVGVVVVVGLLMVGGCGQRQVSSTWYNPSWTPSGNIMAIREDSTYYTGGGVTGGGGVADVNSVLVEMDGDGGNERVLMELGRERFPRINVSPGGRYVALHENQSSVIRIYRRSDMGLVASIMRNTEIYKEDWGPNEELLIGDQEGIWLYTAEGVLQRAITGYYTFTGWKGPYIAGSLAFESTEMTFFDSFGVEAYTAPSGTPIGFSSYFPGNTSYFTGGGGTFSKISLPSFTIVETYVALGEALPPDYHDLQLNPSNGTEVVFSIEPGTVRFSSARAVDGIYEVNLDGTNMRTIRKSRSYTGRGNGPGEV